VPYGVQPGEPTSKRGALKGVVSGIGVDDTVLIWNGSIMEWLDADTVIRAMALVRERRPDVKVFFLGVEHPDYVTGLLFDPPKRAVQLARDLGLFGENVIFNFEWVPYSDIGPYLAEADIGVCAALDSMEQRLSSRTRIVDLFWAGLPIVCTRGDLFAERIERAPLGIAVDSGDVDAYAAAILRLVEDRAFAERCRANMPAINEELSWERALAPLVEFCRRGESIAASKRARLAPIAQRGALQALALAGRAPWYARTRLSRAGNAVG
jgi:glycosyltransferase involved in cell wall biosynthesis